MADMVERVAVALESSFREAVAASAGEPFETTGVTLPKRELWERYARAAIDAMRPELLRLVDEFDGRFDYPESVVFAVKEALEAALTPSPPSPAHPDAHSSRT